MIKLAIAAAIFLGLGGAIVRFLPSASEQGAAAVRAEVAAGTERGTGRWAEYRITVVAKDLDVYGRPWDGVGGGGSATGPIPLPISLSSPPDMALCTLTPQLECFVRVDGRSRESLCPDSFRCAWTVSVPSGRPFGIVIVDLDWAGPDVDDANDLVDAAVIARAGQSALEVELAMRAAIARLARTRIALPSFVPPIPWVTDGRTLRINPGEEARRSAPLSVFPLGACAVTACMLNQSSILIERIR